jgi:CDP-diacylglycerol--serine O-phosphatidyltransferase
LNTIECHIFIYLRYYMSIKKHIPNAITCCNLLCGCLAIVQAFEGNLVYSAYLVGLAAIFDFFDGFAARMLKVSSPIGKDLDSLADMVTFGVVPGIVMFKLLQINEFSYENAVYSFQFIRGIEYLAFTIPIFSAIRLAKFNNDIRQSDSFIGVPTPANAILIGSLTLIILPFIKKQFYNLSNQSNENFIDVTTPGELVDRLFFIHCMLLFITLIFSFLLVSELPLFALKFKHFKWKDNEIRFVFLGLSLVMLVALQFIGIPLIIILYILMSVISNLTKKKLAS